MISRTIRIFVLYIIKMLDIAFVKSCSVVEELAGIHNRAVTLLQV